jgi:protein-S-isoprenylcysteine O-methyltransferase Ste14
MVVLGLAGLGAVATGGPYQFVRHPGYVGQILFELATPIMLSSWWALIPGGFATLFFCRTDGARR